MKLLIISILLSFLLLVLSSCDLLKSDPDEEEDPGVCSESVNYEGKTYNTILIGDQCWLKENLDVGTRIVNGMDMSALDPVEKYCYNNEEANCATYGGLYQWNEAMNYTTDEGAQGICPSGWHIPTLAEFETLADEVGDRIDNIRFTGGNSLKAIGQGSEIGAGTNTSGFSALLGGHVYSFTGGSFLSLNQYTYFWSSSRWGTSSAYNIDLSSHNNEITLTAHDWHNGYSIRCLKD